MIIKLLASFFSPIGLEKGRSNTVSVSPAPLKNEIEKKPQRTTSPATASGDFSKDIEALENHFGQLESGRAIEITLRELLEICPRNRKKSDAFKGLKSHLIKAHGTELRIVPNSQSHVC